MRTTKTVTIDLCFEGTGKIIESPKNRFHGGVVQPDLAGGLSFEVWPEVLNEDGILNPPHDAGTVDGAFQISIEGTSAAYRELGRYLLAVAELDTSADAGFHEHHEVVSADGRTHLHLIVRKPGE